MAKTDTPSPSFLLPPSLLNSLFISSTVSLHRWCFNKAARVSWGANKHADILESGMRFSALITISFSAQVFLPLCLAAFKIRGKVNAHDPGFELTSSQPQPINAARVPSPMKRAKRLLLLITTWQNTTSRSLLGHPLIRLVWRFTGRLNAFLKILYFWHVLLSPTTLPLQCAGNALRSEGVMRSVF